MAKHIQYTVTCTENKLITIMHVDGD